MAYSFMTVVSDGTLKAMPITFNYMKEDDIVVHQNVTKLTKGIDYTINNNIITFAKVIPALDRIAVDRMSQRDSLRVNFVEGATFSRDNIDDVLTQLLYLTQEAVEGSVDRISPTGILDLAGNRIINLGDPVDLQDAVPLHLVVDAEKSIYASEAKCKQYRDEALGYKDEAFTYADRAYASELNAKKAEEIALQLLAESAEASKLITENLPEMRELAASAEESADRAGAMVDRVEDALVAVEEYDDRLNTVETKLENALIRRIFEIPQDPSSSLEERYFLFNVNDYSGVAEASFHSNHHVKGKITVSSGYANGHGRISVDSFFNETINNSARRVCGVGLSSSGDVYVHVMKASGTSTHTWVVTSQGGIHIATSLALEEISSATYVDFVDLTRSKVRSGYDLFERDVRVYSENNKPSPSAIGAVASSNVVGTLAGGALFEKYYTPDGWTVIKRIDGTMELSNTIILHNKTLSSSGFVTVFNTSLPEQFKTVPALSATCNIVGSGYPDGGRAYLVSNKTTNSHTGFLSIYSTSSFTNCTMEAHIRFTGEWLNINRVSTLEEPEVDDSILGDLDEPVYYDTPQVLPYDPEI